MTLPEACLAAAVLVAVVCLAGLWVMASGVDALRKRVAALEAWRRDCEPEEDAGW